MKARNVFPTCRPPRNKWLDRGRDMFWPNRNSTQPHTAQQYCAAAELYPYRANVVEKAYNLTTNFSKATCVRWNGVIDNYCFMIFAIELGLLFSWRRTGRTISRLRLRRALWRLRYSSPPVVSVSFQSPDRATGIRSIYEHFAVRLSAFTRTYSICWCTFSARY